MSGFGFGGLGVEGLGFRDRIQGCKIYAGRFTSAGALLMVFTGFCAEVSILAASRMVLHMYTLNSLYKCQYGGNTI